MGTESLDDDALLDNVQRETFAYFLHLANPVNGLVADCTRPGWPCSIAATGLALASHPIGVERGWMKREEALARTRSALEFFAASEQSEAPDATGHRGFYYHFLDMASGRRTWDSEVSTIDSTFLIAGALLAARYFAGASAAEARVRTLAEALYVRMDWRWAQTGGAAISHPPVVALVDRLSRGAPLPGLCGARGAVRPRRRHLLTVGGGRVAAVRAGSRAADDSTPDRRARAEARRSLRLRSVVQAALSGRARKGARLGSAWNYGINQGPIVLMIENYRSGMPWRLMRGCAPLAEGLRRVGFAGGWLG